MDDKGVIKGNHQFKDFSGNILPNGNGSITGNVDSKAAKVKLTLKDMSNPPVSVMSMSGVWLSGLSRPEDWSVAISGDAKGAMDPLTIVSYQDSNNPDGYANIFDVSGSGLLSDGFTPISIDGYFFFTPAKKTVYGIYDQLVIGANSPEDGTFSGTLNLTSGSIKFFMTSSNGNKYTLTGQKKP